MKTVPAYAPELFVALLPKIERQQTID